MSTRDIAYNIFQQLSEEQLKVFIATFQSNYGDTSETNVLTKKQQAFQRLKEMIHHIPDLDDEKELAEYREEKYGR